MNSELMSAGMTETPGCETANEAKSGEYEPYNTSHHFDRIYHNPQWLG